MEIKAFFLLFNIPRSLFLHLLTASEQKLFCSIWEVGGGLGSENRKVHRVSSSLCHCTLSINLHFKPLVTQTPANCRPCFPVGPGTQGYIYLTLTFASAKRAHHTASCNSITPYMRPLCPQQKQLPQTANMIHKHDTQILTSLYKVYLHSSLKKFILSWDWNFVLPHISNKTKAKTQISRLSFFLNFHLLYCLKWLRKPIIVRQLPSLD